VSHLPNHPRSKVGRWNTNMPSNLVRHVPDEDSRDEVAYALAELAGRMEREGKASLATRTVMALRIASAAARRTGRPLGSSETEGLRGRRSSAGEVPRALMPAAPGLRNCRSDGNAGDSPSVDPTGCRTQCGSQMR
jgi:hypothetical protein